MSWKFESGDLYKTRVIRYEKRDVKYLVGTRIGILTLKIIGIPEGEVRGNIWNEILKEIIEEKGLRFKKENKNKTKHIVSSESKCLARWMEETYQSSTTKGKLQNADKKRKP